MQRLELGPGVDAEFLDEEVSGSSKGGESLGLASRAVQREQVEGTEILPEGVLLGQHLRVGAALSMLTQPQPSIEQHRLRPYPRISERDQVTVDGPKIAELPNRIATPQRQRLPAPLDRLSRIVVQHACCRVDRSLELDRVDRDAHRRQDVARSFGPEIDRRTQRTTEPGDLDLDHVACALRRSVAPERLEERVDPHDLVEVMGECDQHRLRLRPTHIDRQAVAVDEQRSEHADLHCRALRPHLATLAHRAHVLDRPPGPSPVRCGALPQRWRRRSQLSA